jgi:hypothetical protein
LLFILLQIPECLEVDARPESSTNPIGDRHQITAEVNAEGSEEWIIFFEVIAGPNSGENSLLDCDASDDECGLDLEEEAVEECEGVPDDEVFDCLVGVFGHGECSPDCVGSGDRTVSWSYRGTGGPGTDYIIVCAATLLIEQFASRDAIADVGISQIDDELREELESYEEDGCDVLTKTWKDDSAEAGGRFLGGSLFAGDMSAAERNRERAMASAVVATAPRAAETTVRPPSTGDGGLLP